MTKTLSAFVTFCVLFTSPAFAGELGPRADKAAPSMGQALPAAAPDDDSNTARNRLPYESRSPLLAGALSIVPGGGQLYNEHYVVGGIWMAGNIALYMGALAYAGAFDSSEKFDIRWRLESILLFAAAGGLHLFSIFDAVTEADRVNDNLERFSVMVNPDGGGVTVGYGFGW
jgi:hypothetical protein